MRKCLIAILLLTLVFPSCKKGENDPFFSIIPRKKRLEGEWTLYQGNGDRIYSYVNAHTTYNATETYNYINFLKEVNFNNGLQEVDYSVDMYVFLKFYDKDSIELVWKEQQYDPITGELFIDETIKLGTWTWSAGDGKTKSHIKANFTWVKNMQDCPNCDTTITNYSSENPDSYLFKLDRLAKKELNLSYVYASADSSDISSWYMEFLKD